MENYMKTNKTCNKCNQTKDVSEFSRRNTGRLQPWCRECNTTYQRKWYASNKKVHNETIKARKLTSRKTLYQLIREYLMNNPCVICGESDPVVLEFDHIDRNSKHGNISSLVNNGYSWAAIQLEIEKCQVLCANCHRRKTFDESSITKKEVYENTPP